MAVEVSSVVLERELENVKRFEFPIEFDLLSEDKSITLESRNVRPDFKRKKYIFLENL